MRDPEKTRQTILNAALECFSKTGYSDTSINDIIAESGISKGGFYSHFTSKRELFLEIERIWLDEFEALIEGIFGIDSLDEDSLERVFSEFETYVKKEPYRFDLMFEFMYQSKFDEEHCDVVYKKTKEFETKIGIIVRKALQKRHLDKFLDVDTITFAIFNFFLGLFIQIILFQRDKQLVPNASKTLKSLLKIRFPVPVP